MIARNSAVMDRYTRAWTATNLLIRQGKSFSGNEANCCFLNTGTSRFTNISGISGFDFQDDGRSIATTDWDGDGDVDFWITNRTSPRVRFLRNDLNSQNHFLQLKLQGTSCNRDAIGARVELYVRGSTKAWKTDTVRAGDGFLGQSTKKVLFGLGHEREIDRVIVRWPGGDRSEFPNLQMDERYQIVQGESPKRQNHTATTSILSAKSLNAPPAAVQIRTMLTAGAPAPRLPIQTNEGEETNLVLGGRTTLLVLWASWCGPCIDELRELATAEKQLRDSGIRVIALNVDGLGDDSPSSNANKLIEQIRFPFENALATHSLVQSLDVLQQTILDRKRTLTVPSSFLIDASGNVSSIYKGRIDIARLLADIDSTTWNPDQRRRAAIPFDGRWSFPPEATDPMRIATGLHGANLIEIAIDYTRKIEQYVANGLGSKYMSKETKEKKLAEACSFRGVMLMEQDRLPEAAVAFQSALQHSPNDLRSHMTLGEIFAKQGRPGKAAQELRAAIEIAPNDPDLRYDLAIALTSLGQIENAVAQYRSALELRPDWPPAANNLAWILSTHSEASIRDGAAAVKLAHAACQRVRFLDPIGLDTLASAFAETGDFPNAIKSGRRALILARSSDNMELVRAIEKRLRLYEKAIPYRDPTFSSD